MHEVHTTQDRLGDPLHVVGSTNPPDVRSVDRKPWQALILEGLRRFDFQQHMQWRERVEAMVRSHLVDLVQESHRVGRCRVTSPAPSQVLNTAPGAELPQYTARPSSADPMLAVDMSTRNIGVFSSVARLEAK